MCLPENYRCTNCARKKEEGQSDTHRTVSCFRERGSYVSRLAFFCREKSPTFNLLLHGRDKSRLIYFLPSKFLSRTRIVRSISRKLDTRWKFEIVQPPLPTSLFSAEYRGRCDELWIESYMLLLLLLLLLLLFLLRLWFGGAGKSLI